MIQTLYLVPEYKEEQIYPAICKAMEALSIQKDMRPDQRSRYHPPSRGQMHCALAQGTRCKKHYFGGKFRGTVYGGTHEKYLSRLWNESS